MGLDRWIGVSWARWWRRIGLWRLVDFVIGIGVGLDQLWLVGLDWRWVLDFGFGIGMDQWRLEIVVILFLAWFDGGVLAWFELML